jgi:hypothetical protein
MGTTANFYGGYYGDYGRIYGGLYGGSRLAARLDGRHKDIFKPRPADCTVIYS